MPSGDLYDVSVVTVNYNTVELIALLLWSLHRVLAPSRLARVVVVDNGSTDGSVELLRGLAAAGVCELLANPVNRYHGPGLNQGIAHLTGGGPTQAQVPYWVWVLDSDCVVARTDALDHALALAASSGSAVVGENEWDPWVGQHRFGAHCLLLDAAQVWRPGISGFTDGGDPSLALLRSAGEAGLVLSDFPFLAEGYVIHRGRGTLDRVAAAGESSNQFYDWAKDHREAHFGQIPGAAQRYQELLTRFRTEVGDLSASSLVSALANVQGPTSGAYE